MGGTPPRRARALGAIRSSALALALSLALVPGIILSSAPAPAEPGTVESRPGDLGLLDWGGPPGGAEWSVQQLKERLAHPQSDALGWALKRAMERAAATLREKTPVLDALHFEHVLSKDPKYKASLAATQPFEDALLWALCARVAEPPLRGRCGSKAAQLALDWMDAYAPTGNPIDESRFVPLFQAIDLMAAADAAATPEPFKDSTRVRALKAWVRTFARAGDRYYSELPAKSDRRTNNWMSWRLLIRGVAAAVGADSALQMSTVQMFRDQLQANIADDGSSRDFHQRDSLHYHVYDLEPLLEASLYVPWAIDAQGAARILKAVRFLEPFVNGMQKHAEFVHSTVAFDAERRKAGDPVFQNAPWRPEGAKLALLLARARFPEVRGWAKPARGGAASPWIDLLSGLYQGK